MLEVEKTLSQLENKINGGVKASRNNSKCYSKQNQKEISSKNIQSVRNLSFSRKHLSLETAYTSLGISENLKNLLKIRTSGDISTLRCSRANPALQLWNCEGCQNFLLRVYVSM